MDKNHTLKGKVLNHTTAAPLTVSDINRGIYQRQSPGQRNTDQLS